MKLRYKCSCGKVFDANESPNCPACNKPVELVREGAIQIYRKGSPIGVAAGMGLYINGEAYGHIANTESIRLFLPYGSYNIHMTLGLTRHCEDIIVELSKDNPVAYLKAGIKMGFWRNTVKIEKSTKSEMPE